MRLISLDCSSTTVGIAILDAIDNKITLIHQEYFKPPKSDKASIFERLDAAKKHITKILDGYNPEEFAIEDIILFMKGKSRAKTIIPLALFNRTMGLLWFERTGKHPHLLNVMSIRHRLKLSKVLPDKEDMPELVAKHLGIEFPYYYKINKKTKKQEIMEESRDVADSIAVGIAFIFEHIEKRPKLKFAAEKRKKK